MNMTAHRDSDLAIVPIDPLALVDKAIGQGMTVDQLGKLLDLIERRERGDAAKAWAAAVTGFQRECPQIKKVRQAKGSDKFTGFAYASLDDVDEVVRPLLMKWGIVVTYTMGQPTNALMPCTCHVRVGTHVEDTQLSMPIPQLVANDTQKYGGAVTYLRRYTLCAALNIIISDEDDDAASLDKITAEEAAQVAKLIEEKVKVGLQPERFWAWCTEAHRYPADAPRMSRPEDIRGTILPKVLSNLSKFEAVKQPPPPAAQPKARK